MMRTKLSRSLAIFAAMALALALAGCDNGASPGGGNLIGNNGGGGNGDTTTPTFTVTFDSAGGSPVESQTVPQGGVATEPADHPGAGLWYGNVPNFVEWRHEGTRWDFATDTVTGNITLTAHWDGPTAGFITGVAANNLAEAVAHANANAGAFTLAISQDVAVSRYETLTSNTNLTIIGLGGQREISRTGNWAIFSVGYGGRPVSNVRLTLGNGITLTRAAPGDGVLVWIEGNNTFVMEDGSKITRNNCDGGAGIPRGAVYIRAGSTFYMEGGEITGNHASLGHANEVAGVLVRGTLNQTGGIIYGNTTIAANDHPNVRVDGGTRTVNGEPAGNS